MYFALDQNIDSLETYTSFLMDIIENENDTYKAIFHDILVEVHKLVQTKNYYTVQSERFGIISYFAEQNDILKIDPAHIKKSDFELMLGCLQKELTH